MTKLRIQAPVMSNLAFLEVIKFGYFIGCVTAMYRSSDITTRCKMEAVHIQTSTASQIEHLEKQLSYVWFKKTEAHLLLYTQIPGRLFSPGDTCKKLSYHFLLHFPIGMSPYDHHAKYQGVFLENTFFVRVSLPQNKENLNEFMGIHTNWKMQ